jgi:hypothetical protein
MTIKLLPIAGKKLDTDRIEIPDRTDGMTGAVVIGQRVFVHQYSSTVEHEMPNYAELTAHFVEAPKQQQQASGAQASTQTPPPAKPVTPAKS